MFTPLNGIFPPFIVHAVRKIVAASRLVRKFAGMRFIFKKIVNRP